MLFIGLCLCLRSSLQATVLSHGPLLHSRMSLPDVRVPSETDDPSNMRSLRVTVHWCVTFFALAMTTNFRIYKVRRLRLQIKSPAQSGLIAWKMMLTALSRKLFLYEAHRDRRSSLLSRLRFVSAQKKNWLAVTISYRRTFLIYRAYNR